jgi:hypothetical protein
MSPESSLTPIKNQEGHSRFEKFWETYPRCPRKVNKKGCKELWAKQGLDKHALSIIGNVEWHTKNNPQWKDGAFIPMPITYLRQARWDDGLFETKKHGDLTRPLPEPPKEEAYFSFYACNANIAMLKKIPRGGYGKERLLRLLAKKAEIVALAESERWDHDDFLSIMQKAIDRELIA